MIHGENRKDDTFIEGSRHLDHQAQPFSEQFYPPQVVRFQKNTLPLCPCYTSEGNKNAKQHTIPVIRFAT